MGQYQEGQRLQGSDGKVYVVHGGVPRQEIAEQSGPPAFIPGTTSPYKQAAEQRAQAGETRAAEDQQFQRDKFEREQANANKPKLPTGYQWGPDGKSAVPIPGVPIEGAQPIKPEDLVAVREEAKAKLELIDRLEKQSKEGWFTTGFGASAVANIGGTEAANLAANVKTVGNAGALQRIMEMSKANGGKNPLAPLSEGDFKALSQSVSNLDPSQSDEQFQQNLNVYRDIYKRAYEGAGGNPAELMTPEARANPRAHGESILRSKLDELKANFLAKNPKGQRAWEGIEANAWRQFNNDQRVPGRQQSAPQRGNSGGWGKAKVVD